MKKIVTLSLITSLSLIASNFNKSLELSGFIGYNASSNSSKLENKELFGLKIDKYLSKKLVNRCSIFTFE
jgi:hypothetical protein